MTSPLSGSLARTIGGAFNGLFLDATLTRDGATTGPAYDPTPGAPETFDCKAIFDSYGTGQLAGGLVASTDVKVLILAVSLATDPVSGDRVTLQGVTVTIAPKGIQGQPAVQIDPARAVWECRGLS